MRFEPAAGPRRAGFGLVVSRIDRVDHDRMERIAYLVVEHATDPSAALRPDDPLDESALVNCLSTLRAPIRDPRVLVRLSIGADGRVTSHDVKWPAKIPADLVQCLDGVVAQGQFNCPLSGQAAIDGRLHLEVARKRRR